MAQQEAPVAGSVRVTRNGGMRPYEQWTVVKGAVDVLTAGEPHLTAGFYEVVPGDPQKATWSAEEMKIILSGELIVEEEGQEPFTATAKDVLFIPAGATVAFSTNEGALAFYVAHRDPLR
jgi:ethanolamine utilization protein EutQ